MVGDDEASPLDLNYHRPYAGSFRRECSVRNDVPSSFGPNPHFVPERPRQMPHRVTTVGFLSFFKFEHSFEFSRQPPCKRNPNASIREEEWKTVNGPLEKKWAGHTSSLPHLILRGVAPDDIISDDGLFSQQNSSSDIVVIIAADAVTHDQSDSSSSLGNSWSPENSSSSSWSSDPPSSSSSDSSSSSEASSSDEDDTESHVSLPPITRRWSWPARPRLRNRAQVRDRAAEVVIRRRTRSVCGARLGWSSGPSGTTFCYVMSCIAGRLCLLCSSANDHARPVTASSTSSSSSSSECSYPSFSSLLSRRWSWPAFAQMRNQVNVREALTELRVGRRARSVGGHGPSSWW